MGGNEVDVETLRAYADGPLEDAITSMKDALRSLDSGASPQTSSYPPAGQHGADGHREAVDEAGEMLVNGMEGIVKMLERLQDTIQNYVTTEQTNTELADQPIADL